jgi:hypothetical protein
MGGKWAVVMLVVLVVLVMLVMSGDGCRWAVIHVNGQFT